MGEASRAVVVTKLQMVFASFPLKTVSWLIICTRGVLLTRLAVKNSVRTQGYSPGPVTPFVLLDCFFLPFIFCASDVECVSMRM